MGWLVIGVLLVSLAAVLVSASSLRFRRMVGREALDLWRAPGNPAPPREGDLPAPIARYLRTVLAGRTAPIRAVRLQHGGTFRMDPHGRCFPIRGEEYFASDPPGYVWWGRVRIAPGLWIDARDHSMSGEGSMRVLLASTIQLVDAAGPQLDQGALLRLVAETTLFPTILADARHVTWTPRDDRSATATLRVAGREVSALFEVNDEGLVWRISGERWSSSGKSPAVLRPWSGTAGDYREAGGVLVPHVFDACWELPEGKYEYAHFVIDTVELDRQEPF